MSGHNIDGQGVGGVDGGEAVRRVPRGGTAGFSPAALRRALERHDLAIEDLADEIGVSRQAVSSWLGGVTTPSPASLVSAAKAVGLTPADLTPGVSDHPYLADLRGRAGLTQTEVAKSLGMAKSVLSDIERGRRAPDPSLLALMAPLYAVSEKTLRAAWDRGVEDRAHVRDARSRARRRDK